MNKTTQLENIRPNPSGDWPQIDATAYLDPSAQVIGKVEIDRHVFVGPNAVIRADETGEAGVVEPILIGPECNVQDGVIIHARAGSLVMIMPRTTMAHGSIIHGPCTLGPNCFVGFRVVLYNVKLADGVFIGHGAVVCNVELPPNCSVPSGVSIQSTDQVAELAMTGRDEREFMEKVIAENINLTKGYLGF